MSRFLDSIVCHGMDEPLIIGALVWTRNQTLEQSVKVFLFLDFWICQFYILNISLDSKTLNGGAAANYHPLVKREI